MMDDKVTPMIVYKSDEMTEHLFCGHFTELFTRFKIKLIFFSRGSN